MIKLSAYIEAQFLAIILKCYCKHKKYGKVLIAIACIMWVRRSSINTLK